ncbi:MAG TPA: hypothetical protein VN646_22585 [Candidatus Acidoferrum sp.]|jgi:hypothetical protein|nr:hypothetical protein [Candidatus Acidoferrum sp.]
MSTTSPLSNVYYLAPPASVAEQRPRRSRGLTLHHRLLAFWWRLRLTTAEVVATVRRFGRAPVDADAAFLEQRADLILAGPRPSAGPAQIIDFVAARTRLRA